jgi:hypothetical protein
MKFSATRKALKKVKGNKVRKDLEGVVTTIEKAAGKNRPVAAKATNQLLGFVVALQETISHRTRLAVVEAIFADARKGEVPHQWERKQDCECGKANDCSKPKQDSTCYHDTSGPACISG